MNQTVLKTILVVSAGLLACGESKTENSGPGKWPLKLEGETRNFVAHGCRNQGERLYCLAGESEDPGAFPRLTFYLPLPLENKVYKFQPADSETEAISCQSENTGLIYRSSNESEPYFSCARGAGASIKVSDSGDNFTEAGLSASLADKDGKKLTISFEKIRFSLN